MFSTLVSCNHNIDYSLYETAYGMKGTELYCWEIADNAWKCGALEGTNRNKTFEELKMIQESYPCPLDTMKTILAKFPDKARKEIFGLIIDFPLTSAS
ncbi:MAG: hypothetical protein RSE56_03615 [Bacilli bacterium]